MIANKRPARPLTVDMGLSRSCGDRRRTYGQLQPMETVRPSYVLRAAVIVGATAVVWLAIAALVLLGGRV